MKRAGILVLAMLLAFTAVQLCAFAAADIEVGDYVEMGEYYGETVIWRCVAVDSNGPLMLSDKVLCFKAFDAAGENGSGSHARHAYNSTFYRQQYGSNYWTDSNIRAWLNSDSSAVAWSCGNAPDTAHVWAGHNAYSDEAGFLNSFSSKGVGMIKSVSQKTLLSRGEYEDMTSYGSAFHTFNNVLSKIVQNYDSAFSEEVTDKVFLLDAKQLYALYQNRSVLGDSYFAAYPTAQAAANSEYPISADEVCKYWLRTPTASNVQGTAVRTCENDDVRDIAAYNGSIGVRPAFYFDNSKVEIGGGSGTELFPYTIAGAGKPKIEITSSVYSEGELSISANVRIGDNSEVYVAFGAYDANGNLTGVISEIVTADITQTYTLAVTDDTETVRGFIWDSKNTIAAINDGECAKSSVEEDMQEVAAYISFDDSADIGSYQKSGTVNFTEGLLGNAAYFDGNASNYLTIQSATGNDLLAGKDEVTVSFFLKTTDEIWPFYASPIAGAPTYQAENYIGILDRVGTLEYERYLGGRSASTSSAISGVSCSSNTWHHLALVLTPSSSDLYIDGSLGFSLASSSTLRALFPTTSYIFLGHSTWDSGESYTGYIDEFKVFDKALTPEEIQKEMDRAL
ncbi:MAG: DUF6273 domain-containing protein [Clostridia bacterium]|nr:DUF6273 domain-containing protein [Clostridia bacterium]